MPSGPLYREDVLFGRAVLAFGIAKREALAACIEEQHRRAAAGEPRTLARVALERGLLTYDQYRRLAEEVKRRYPTGAPNDVAADAAAALPDITQSGRYPGMAITKEQALAMRAAQNVPPAPHRGDTARLPKMPEPPPPDATVDKAVARFGRHADEVVDAGSEWEVVSESTPAEGVATPLAVSQDDWKKRLAGTERHQGDAAIREKLGVGDAETFDFGPYRELRFLGAGAAGVVYRAIDDGGRAVALKVLGNLDASETALRRFLREARAAMELDHPGIVKVHDVGVLDDLPYFAMDLVVGRELRAVLDAEKPAREVLLALVARICDAVAFAHDRGIVHRDLKPQNIMVRESDGAPLLTDFGLAKDLNEKALKLTGEGTIIGTPVYAAPELHRDAAAATARSDVWSLGVILYEATAGRLPFVPKGEPGALLKFIERVATEAAPPPSKVDKTSPRALDPIALKALEKDPEKRYATARAMAEDLERVLRGEVPAASKASLGLLGRIASRLRGK